MLEGFRGVGGRGYSGLRGFTVCLEAFGVRGV